MVTHASSNSRASKTVLFYRDMRAFSGGHLKVFHYYTHVRDAPGFSPRIAFSDRTVWDAGNPWRDQQRHAESDWTTDRGDVFFIAGMDWRVALPRGVRHSGKPVINLIQHVRHADPTQDVHPFLNEPAIRICVSAEVEAAILATGKVVGPTFVIPNGIELEPIAPGHSTAASRREGVLVVGTKNQAFAAELAGTLRGAGIDAELHGRFVPRSEFVETLTRFAVTVFCPDPTEGFYLPALEGMNRGTFVICPDCVGNRGFCIHGATCLVPAYTLDAMLGAVRHALTLSQPKIDAIRQRAFEKASEHSLAGERKRFLQILNDTDALWGRRGRWAT